VNFINSPAEPANIPHNLLSNSDNPIKAATKAKQLTIINLDKPRKRWMVRWEGKLALPVCCFLEAGGGEGDSLNHSHIR
jgi:hypothetical protein